MMGKGINADNIACAASFLCGACSCSVKEFNHGIDLLMTANWNEVFKDGVTAPAIPPPSAGEPVPIPRPLVPSSKTQAVASIPEEATGGLWSNRWLVAAGATGLLVIAAAFMLALKLRA